jgi:outer membrane protein OmpA-like peptidoglycan-associated protein
MMMRMRLYASGLALLGAACTAIAATPDRYLSFVTCPIIRDTELPCWLAEYEGELYFLGMQGDSASAFNSPQLKHRALIEAKVGSGERICGGIPLESVHVSVMQEIDSSCETILPAEGFTPPPYERGPGPAVRPHPAAPRKDPAPPYTAQEYVLEFEFDNEFLARRNTRKLEELVRFVELSKARAVRIEGTRAISLLSDGTRLVESETIAKRRAERVARILVDLGIPTSMIETRWSAEPLPGNGIDDYTRRRVTIRVEVGAAAP